MVNKKPPKVDKRILFIGNGIGSKRREAVNVNFSYLSQVLLKAGYKNYFLSFGFPNMHNLSTNFGNSFLDVLLHLPKFIKETNKIIIKNKIDIVYDVFVLPLVSLVVTLPLKILNPRVKFIKEIQNLPGFSKKLRKESLIRLVMNTKWQIYLITKTYNIVLSRNKYVANKLKLKYAPPYIGERMMLQKNNSSKLRICFLGHPLAKKGIDIFPKVIKNISPNLAKKIEFNFAFSNITEGGKYVKSIEAAGRLKKIKINFYKEVDPFSFFNKNDVFVLPLEDDYSAIATPTSILEAMSSGCLVVSKKISSLKGIIKNNFSGILLDQFDTAHVVKVINDLLSDKKAYKRMTENAFESILLNYSERKILDFFAKYI